jgi:hypothetical protein
MTKLPVPASSMSALEDRLDELPALDTAEVVERTLARILSAEDAATIFADPEAMGLRDLVGREVELVGIAGCLPSRHGQGPSRYLVLECADPATGERFAVTTGSVYAMAAAVRAWEAGLLPQRVRVVELESASNPGQTSTWLVKA